MATNFKSVTENILHEKLQDIELSLEGRVNILESKISKLEEKINELTVSNEKKDIIISGYTASDYVGDIAHQLIPNDKPIQYYFIRHPHLEIVVMDGFIDVTGTYDFIDTNVTQGWIREFLMANKKEYITTSYMCRSMPLGGAVYEVVYYGDFHDDEALSEFLKSKDTRVMSSHTRKHMEFSDIEFKNITIPQ